MTKKPYKGKGRKSTGAYTGFTTSLAKTTAIARDAMVAIRQIRGMINCEKHYKDLEVSSGTTISWSGTTIHCTGVSQGDDVDGRQGNSILGRSLWIQLLFNANATSTSSYIRMIVYRDKMNQGATPLATEVLTPALVSSANAPLAPLNVDQTSRFQIMYDKRFIVSSDSKDMVKVAKYLNFQNHVKFTGTAGTDEFQNHLYILLISNEQTNTPTVGGVIRFGYYDN